MAVPDEVAGDGDTRGDGAVEDEVLDLGVRVVEVVVVVVVVVAVDVDEDIDGAAVVVDLEGLVSGEVGGHGVEDAFVRASG